MAQTLFICGLYSLGFAFGLLFKKKIPLAFICLTGYLWGCTFYVGEAMLLIGLRIPYSLLNMAILSGVVLAILVVVNYFLGNWHLGYRGAAWLAGTLFVFILCSLAINRFNPTVVTADSLSQLMIGREIGFDGFSAGVTNYLSLTGPFMLVLQSASVLIGSEYLYTLIPSFSLSLFLVFIYITYRSIKRIPAGGVMGLWVAILAALVLFSSDFMIYQSFYIHDNLTSAAYLFTAVGVCWLAVSEENNTWLVFAVPALISFSLLRTETVIFAVFILFLMINQEIIPGQVRRWLTFPFVGIMLGWYIVFYFNFLTDSFMLNPARIMVLIALIASFGIYGLIVGYGRLGRWVQAKLVYVVSGGALLLLAGLLILNAGNVVTGVVITVENMLVYGQWGIIWYVVMAGLILAFTQPRFKKESILVLILAIYFLFVLALGWLRTLVFHLGREDSGNRMLTHILPLAVYYLILKYSPGFFGQVSRIKVWLSKIKYSGTLSEHTTIKEALAPDKDPPVTL
jgi:hypothetical protein